MRDLITLPRDLQPRARHLTYRAVDSQWSISGLLDVVVNNDARSADTRLGLSGDGPDEAGEFPGDGHDDLVFVQSTGTQLSESSTQAQLRLPGDVDRGLASAASVLLRRT